MEFQATGKNKAIIRIDDDRSDLADQKWYYNLRAQTITRSIREKIDERTYAYKTIYLEREIVNCPDDRKVVALDGNILNCTRDNLRIATLSDIECHRGKNKNNSSGYKGVSFLRKSNTYVALIAKDNKRYYLGKFADAKEAYKAYCSAAVKLHGEFAILE